MNGIRGLGLIGVVAMTAVAAAQFVANRGSIQLSASSGGYSADPSTGTVRYPMVGAPGRPVRVSDSQSGTTFTAATAMTVIVGSQQGKSKVTSINAEGAVTFTRSDDRGGTTMTGSGAMYRSDNAEGDLTIAGPVAIRGTDSVAKRDYNATGSRLVARTTAIETAKGPDSLYTAALAGPVRFEGTSVAGERIVATGDRLDIDNRRKPSTVTLTGNIKIVSTGGPNEGDVSGMSRLVITLNEKNEVATIEGTGNPTRTVIRPQGGGGA